jgi:hypothetical protein
MHSGESLCSVVTYYSPSPLITLSATAALERDARSRMVCGGHRRVDGRGELAERGALGLPRGSASPRW